MSQNEYVDEPWQRNPWVWLVIAIPSLTVAGCLVTVYLALSRPDYLVGDYAGAPAQAEQSAAPAH
jgi:hypothetical protein